MSRLMQWVATGLDSPRLDKPLRVLLGVSLIAYCAVVIFTRWVKEKARGTRTQRRAPGYAAADPPHRCAGGERSAS